MQLRDRVKELRRVRASELLPDPRNYRRHPKAQRDALRAMWDRVGNADVLITRETPDGLMLVDGHLRADLEPDAELSVIVTDLSEDEAGEVLATLDPLAAMAEVDAEKLKTLVDDLSSRTDEAMGELLDSLRLPLPPVDPTDEWQGMPEFEQEDARPHRSIAVHFTKALGLSITEATRFVYYPEPPPRDVTRNLQYRTSE